MELEEGELSNDSVDAYVPLERPTNYSAIQPNQRFQVPIEESDDSEIELRSSESDSSDSDTHLKKRPNKRPKIKLKKLPLKNKTEDVNAKRKKYDIWSTRTQEEVLAATLNCCDVTKKDRSRDVESYDYKSYQTEYIKDFNRKRTNNKRRRDDRSNTNLRLVGRGEETSQDDAKDVTKVSRTILDLVVKFDDSVEEIAKDIANKLYEEKEELIIRAMNVIGKEKTLELFEETQRIEKDGGMLIMNQTRRRTPGGVFFFILRHGDDITEEQKNIIFEDERSKHKTKLKELKKKKSRKYKEEIASARTKLLPDLLTRAELLTKETNRTRKETSDNDVINPPPTPETDGHENSGDGMDNLNLVPILNGNDSSLDNNQRKLMSYEDDFLDIECSNDMDLF